MFVLDGNLVKYLNISLQHLIAVFMLNGYETLDLFSDLEEADLDMLNISNAEDRARILTAAQMLQGYDEGATRIIIQIYHT